MALYFSPLRRDVAPQGEIGNDSDATRTWADIRQKQREKVVVATPHCMVGGSMNDAINQRFSNPHFRGRKGD